MGHSLTEPCHSGPVRASPRHLPFRRPAMSFMRWQTERGVLQSAECSIWRCQHRRRPAGSCSWAHDHRSDVSCDVGRTRNQTPPSVASMTPEKRLLDNRQSECIIAFMRRPGTPYCSRAIRPDRPLRALRLGPTSPDLQCRYGAPNSPSTLGFLCPPQATAGIAVLISDIRRACAPVGQALPQPGDTAGH